MRVVLGRLALLLGVVVVAAMAWYGAAALFDNPESDDETAPTPDCAAASQRDARVANRVFRRKHVDKNSSTWLAGHGVSDTRVLARMAEEGIGAGQVPTVEGNGSILVVMHLPGADVPALPTCIRDVPLVLVPGGPFQFD